MRLILPFGKQSGLSLGLDGTGTVTEETYDAERHPGVDARRAVRADVRRPTRDGRRWLNVGALPADGS